jgi:hypothetical protein
MKNRFVKNEFSVAAIRFITVFRGGELNPMLCVQIINDVATWHYYNNMTYQAASSQMLKLHCVQ